MANLQKYISALLCVSLVFSSMGFDGCKKKTESKNEQAPAVTNAALTPDQLYQLVAPIALFPDKLLAQVFAASTYPDQITDAWAWLQQNSGLKGQQLLQTVDQQDWDVSIKGLTQFPDVMQQMAGNLSWTSALGDAYYNSPQNVMNAVQVMRQRAYQAGNLKTTPQQNVAVQSQPPATEPVAPASSGEEQQVTVVQPPPQTIIIEPSQPDVVYVPSYNPTVVYGQPVPAYPGYSTEALVTTGLISFGVGMLVGAAMSNNGCCGWGWNSWGCGWNNASVNYNNNVYISNSNTFASRGNYYNRNNANINRGNIGNQPRPTPYNRGGDFGNGPRFDERRNQTQFRDERVADRGRNQGIRDQGRRDQGIRDQGIRDQGRGNSGVRDQGRRDQGIRDQGRRDQGIGDRNNNARVNQRDQPQRNDRQAVRGYGDRQNRASDSGLGNYGQGGNARANSARGQQSLNGGGNRGGANAQARTGGGGNRGGGGGGNRGGGGGGRGGEGGNRGGGRNR